jgi:hypothetical protein
MSIVLFHICRAAFRFSLAIFYFRKFPPFAVIAPLLNYMLLFANVGTLITGPFSYARPNIFL